jgi:TIR domain
VIAIILVQEALCQCGPSGPVCKVMAGKIFINYRRDDSSGTAGRLYDRLTQTFGRERLFMEIPAGVDFVTYLNTQVGACDIFLAIIGPDWLNAKDHYGRRRLGNPDDFVSVEIATALVRNIRVIPVLVDGAHIPTADELPESIKPLARRNAIEVRNAHFGRDAEVLVDEVREGLQSPHKWYQRLFSLFSSLFFFDPPDRFVQNSTSTMMWSPRTISQKRASERLPTNISN